MILIPVFEFDVSTNSYLEEKLAVTNCFIRMLGADKLLKEDWSQYSPEMLDLVTQSKDLAPYYQEAEGVKEVTPSMMTLKFIMHMSGAAIYIGCVSAAITLNDDSEIGVPIASMIFMNIFGVITYLCGKKRLEIFLGQKGKSKLILTQDLIFLWATSYPH